jgi:ferredoxin
MRDLPARGTRSTRTREVLRIDPIACDGVGICAHVAPDLITADRWGYPIIRNGSLCDRLERQARAAVRACPHRALFLDAPAPASEPINRLPLH